MADELPVQAEKNLSMDSRERAKAIFLEHGGKIGNKRIATILGENEKTIATWKNRDLWRQALDIKENGEAFRHDDERNRNKKKGRHHQNYKHGVYSSFTWALLNDEERNLLTAQKIAEDPLKDLKEEYIVLTVRLNRAMGEVESLRSLSKDSKLSGKQAVELREQLVKFESLALQIQNSRIKVQSELIKANALNPDNGNVEDVGNIYAMLGLSPEVMR